MNHNLLDAMLIYEGKLRVASHKFRPLEQKLSILTQSAGTFSFFFSFSFRAFAENKDAALLGCSDHYKLRAGQYLKFMYHLEGVFRIRGDKLNIGGQGQGNINGKRPQHRRLSGNQSIRPSNLPKKLEQAIKRHFSVKISDRRSYDDIVSSIDLNNELNEKEKELLKAVAQIKLSESVEPVEFQEITGRELSENLLPEGYYYSNGILNKNGALPISGQPGPQSLGISYVAVVPPDEQGESPSGINIFTINGTSENFKDQSINAINDAEPGETVVLSGAPTFSSGGKAYTGLRVKQLNSMVAAARKKEIILKFNGEMTIYSEGILGSPRKVGDASKATFDFSNFSRIEGVKNGLSRIGDGFKRIGFGVIKLMISPIVLVALLLPREDRKSMLDTLLIEPVLDLPRSVKDIALGVLEPFGTAIAGQDYTALMSQVSMDPSLRDNLDL